MQKEWSCDEDEVNKELKKTAIKKISVCTLIAIGQNVEKENEFFNGFSSFVKMIRMFAYVRRFYRNCRNERKNRVNGLLFSEVQVSHTAVKIDSGRSFYDETDIHVEHLDAFKDKDDLIRLKTKIVLRDDVYNFKCPIVLPGKHRIVSLIIKEKHESLNNAGVEILMNALREECWVIGGRKVICSVIAKCVNCRRYDASGKGALTVCREPLNIDITSIKTKKN